MVHLEKVIPVCTSTFIAWKIKYHNICFHNEIIKEIIWHTLYIYIYIYMTFICLYSRSICAIILHIHSQVQSLLFVSCFCFFFFSLSGRLGSRANQATAT